MSEKRRDQGSREPRGSRRSYPKKKNTIPTQGPKRKSRKKKKKNSPSSLFSTFSTFSTKSSNPHKSPTNEDRYAVLKENNYYLFGVFDGHSGYRISDYVSKHLLKFISKKINQYGILESLFAKTFLDFNKKLQKLFPKSKDGCTATVVYIDKHSIVFINAGDSPAFLLRYLNNRVNTQQMTKDHDYKNELERKRIQSLGGKFIEGYYSVGDYMIQPTRGFGDFQIKKQKGPNNEEMHTALPSVLKIPYTNNDKILVIASDGVTGMGISPESIISAAYRNFWTQKTNTSLVRYIQDYIYNGPLFNNYYPDDVTSIIVNLQKLKKCL